MLYGLKLPIQKNYRAAGLLLTPTQYYWALCFLSRK